MKSGNTHIFTQWGVILIAYIIDKALELAAQSRDSNGQWVKAVGVTTNTPIWTFKGAFELTALKQADVVVIDNADLACNMTDLFQFPFLSNFASMHCSFWLACI